MYLVFDIGATKMRLSISRDGESFETPTIVSTPANSGELVKIFHKTAQDLLAVQVPEAVCGGVTRRYEDAKSEISKLFSCPVFLENDTALVGLGEALSGTGLGGKIVAYITVSTGVGGVRIVDGQIDRHTFGFEPGHQVINFDGEQKTLESCVSGRGLATRFGQEPKLITDPVVWEELAQILAYGLHNTILHWSPELVVLGGSMILGQPGINFNVVQTRLQQVSQDFPVFARSPALKLATLGDFGGLHGALHFLKQKLSR